MYDLIVIGGGPAGTAAAITASCTGARVLLLEKGRFPRHKVCGEFVSAESLDLLSSLLDDEGQGLLRNAGRIPRARLFLDGRVVETAVDPPAASIARFDLDGALWKAAQRMGAEAREQVTVQSLQGQGPFQLKTSARKFEARAAINASGRWSNLTAASSPNGTGRQKWLGLKGHFAEKGHPASVDLYFFDGGYCGVQPVQLAGEDQGGRINVCAMVRSEVASTLPEVLAQHPQLRRRCQSWRVLSETVSTFPLIFREPQAEENGVLRAGDAAGFVDPFIGDGISLALRSGALAARTLTPFFCRKVSLPQAAQAYRDAYARQLLPVFRASSKLRKMLILPRILRFPLLFLLEHNPTLASYLVRKTRQTPSGCSEVSVL